MVFYRSSFNENEKIDKSSTKVILKSVLQNWIWKWKQDRDEFIIDSMQISQTLFRLLYPNQNSRLLLILFHLFADTTDPTPVTQARKKAKLQHIARSNISASRGTLHQDQSLQKYSKNEKSDAESFKFITWNDYLRKYIPKYSAWSATAEVNSDLTGKTINSVSYTEN